MLPVVSHGCETFSISTEENLLRLFENRKLNEIIIWVSKGGSNRRLQKLA
jgi:hypothetical protein